MLIHADVDSDADAVTSGVTQYTCRSIPSFFMLLCCVFVCCVCCILLDCLFHALLCLFVVCFLHELYEFYSCMSFSCSDTVGAKVVPQQFELRKIFDQKPI